MVKISIERGFEEVSTITGDHKGKTSSLKDWEGEQVLQFDFEEEIFEMESTETKKTGEGGDEDQYARGADKGSSRTGRPHTLQTLSISSLCQIGND